MIIDDVALHALLTGFNPKEMRRGWCKKGERCHDNGCNENRCNKNKWSKGGENKADGEIRNRVKLTEPTNQIT